MDIDKKSIKTILENHEDDFQGLIDSNDVQETTKSIGSSLKARKDGNDLYAKTKLNEDKCKEILRLYSKSIAFAPDESEELAVAYGNRSALLFHLEKYQECISDINRALDITQEEDFKIKLNLRKTKCLEALDKSSKTELIDKSRHQENLKKCNEYLEVISKNEEADFEEAFTIQHSEKYGRHLVATRNFQPGEIIFTQKLYASVLNNDLRYTHCHNCLNMSWVGIPCEKCCWVMFCSEKCKSEAMQKYHEIECSIIPYMRHIHEKFIDVYHLSIRIFIIGIKDCSSILQLKTDLEAIDKSTDIRWRGFKNDGKFDSYNFRSVYSLSHEGIFDYLDDFPKMAILILILMIKHTSAFDKKVEIKTVKDLMNEETLFLGALLIKLFKIKEMNAAAFPEAMQNVCKYFKDRSNCIQNFGCTKGTCIATLSSLINHNCYPNVRRCYTTDGKIVIYALQPITEDSQLFDLYCSNFYTMEREKRQQIIQRYGFECDCVACKENWPSFLSPCLPKELQEKFSTTHSELEIDLHRENKDIVKALVENDYGKFNNESIFQLAKAIEKAMKFLSQPNQTLCYLLAAMQGVCQNVYSSNEHM